MKNFSTVWKYYSRKEIQSALLEVARNREVVGVYPTGSFDKRPNVLVYPNDILQMVKRGVVSFHGSNERWSNPMVLEPGMLKQELDKLRIGWDLILDPDCPDFELGKLSVKILIDALKDHGIKNFSLKLTGGKGFHLGLNFESFPKNINFTEAHLMYPDLPKKIIGYLKDYIREQLKEGLLAMDNPLSIANRVGKPIQQITDENGLNPFRVVELDSMIVASRHLFRLPFSLHEKSLLVSLPIPVSRLDKIEKKDADPKRVKRIHKFLTYRPELTEAQTLVVEALDWGEKHKVPERKTVYKGRRRIIKEISKKHFPGCILKTLKGLPDGRKRSLFVLINFLQNMGWSWEKTRVAVEKWNDKNPSSLPRRYVQAQLRWHQRQKQNLLPPNCDNPNFYQSIGTCLPDKFCQTAGKITIKNPVNYPFRKMKTK